MKFRLSTLLIIVAAIAVVCTQHASPVRITIVATIELALAVGWIAAKGFPFPWRIALALVAVCDVVLIASNWHDHFSDPQPNGVWNLVFITPLFGIVFAFLLMIPVSMLFLLYLMADAFFRRDRADLRERRGSETRKSSD